jgi:regulatory protein
MAMPEPGVGDGQPAAPQAATLGPSLKGRALRHLSAREHSRSELLRKLRPHAESEAELLAVLDDLQAKDLLSETRLAQAVVRTGAAKFGNARLKANLQAKGLSAEQVEDALAGLDDDELSRATQVWRKKFAVVATDPKTRAKQMRFLASRGFAQATIHRVVRGGDDDLGGDF